MCIRDRVCAVNYLYFFTFFAKVRVPGARYFRAGCVKLVRGRAFTQCQEAIEKEGWCEYLHESKIDQRRDSKSVGGNLGAGLFVLWPSGRLGGGVFVDSELVFA